MNRLILIQDLIHLNRYSNYLEIGTFKGETFFPIKCNKKIAVDPFFQFGRWEKLKWIFKNPVNFNNRYFEMESNQFFHLKKQIDIDIAFIDGLHTFEASLNDVLNSLNHLSKNGTIIMHDCFPPNSAAAYPAKSYQQVKNMKIKGWTGEWCGDVWKTIMYLKRKFPVELNVEVLNCDYGLGIINFRKEGELNLKIDPELFKEIYILTFNDLMCNPKTYIGLIEPEEFCG